MSISHSPLYRSPPGPQRPRARATPAPHIIPRCPRRHNGRRTVTISASGEREKSLPQAEKGGGKTLVKSKGKTISHRPSNPASNTDQRRRIYSLPGSLYISTILAFTSSGRTYSTSMCTLVPGNKQVACYPRVVYALTVEPVSSREVTGVACALCTSYGNGSVAVG